MALVARSHKDCLHQGHEEMHSSSLPCSSCRPAEKAYKLERTGSTQTGRSSTQLQLEKKLLATDSGSSCRLNISISSASHWTLFGFSFLIASLQNDNATDTLSIKYVLAFITVCFVYSTKAHSIAHEGKPWTHSTDSKNICCAQSLSRLFWKGSKAK